MRWDAILRGLLVAVVAQLLGAVLLTALSGNDWIAANVQLASRFLAALAAVAGGGAAARTAGVRGIAHGSVTGLLFALLISALAVAGAESIGLGRMVLHWLAASAAGGVAGAIAMNV